MVDKKDKELESLFEEGNTFIHDDEKYFIDQPTLKDVKAADWLYSTTYNEALLEGITTSAQMDDILVERGVTGRKYEERKAEIYAEIEAKVAEMDLETDPEKKYILANEVEDLRAKLFRWNQRASSPKSVTCEALSDDARLESLTSSMIKDSDGNRVWKDYEDYKTTKQTALAYMARYHVMLYNNGMSQDFLADLPENLARKEMDEQKLIEGVSETPVVEPVVKAEKPKKVKKS